MNKGCSSFGCDHFVSYQFGCHHVCWYYFVRRDFFFFFSCGGPPGSNAGIDGPLSGCAGSTACW